MYILLYSKYSRSCLKLLDSVDELNSMMNTPTPMVQLVCIDNKETRKQILSSKSIEIKKVPCLLIVDDTVVEKYDGKKAFEWVSEVIQKINAKSQPPPPPPSPPPKTIIQIKNPKPKEQKQTQNKQQNRVRPQKKKTTTTKIEDLDDIEDEEEKDSEPQFKKPPIPNRNESGSYVIDGSEPEENEETEENEEEKNQEKKSTNSPPKGMGVLDLAFAMRQEREKGK